MKSSIVMLLLGAIAGITGTLAYTSVPQPAVTSDHSAQLARLEQRLDGIEGAIARLDKTSTGLSELVSRFGSLVPESVMAPRQRVSRAPAKPVSGAPGNADTDDAFENFLMQLEQGQASTMAGTMQQEPGPRSATVQETPTSEQVSSYKSIENRLFAAANDRSVKLSSLVSEAQTLTDTQRRELTQKALKLIQNGELSTEQFAP